MEPAVDMVIMEGIMRHLGIHEWLLDFMLYGFMDGEAEKNVPAPRKWRCDKKVVPQEAWPVESERRRLRWGNQLGRRTEMRGTQWTKWTCEATELGLERELVGR